MNARMTPQDKLRSIEDNLGLRPAGLYSIPCECGNIYIGQTGRKIIE